MILITLQRLPLGVLFLGQADTEILDCQLNPGQLNRRVIYMGNSMDVSSIRSP